MKPIYILNGPNLNRLGSASRTSMAPTRSTTSPAAIWLISVSDSWWMAMAHSRGFARTAEDQTANYPARSSLLQIIRN